MTPLRGRHSPLGRVFLYNGESYDSGCSGAGQDCLSTAFGNLAGILNNSNNSLAELLAPQFEQLQSEMQQGFQQFQAQQQQLLAVVLHLQIQQQQIQTQLQNMLGCPHHWSAALHSTTPVGLRGRLELLKMPSNACVKVITIDANCSGSSGIVAIPVAEEIENEV
jgi:hypothetical protein